MFVRVLWCASCVLIVKAPHPSNFIAVRPRRLFCFGSLVVLDVVFRYLSLFLLYINIKIGKIDVKC